jgi:threonine dehydrogenase-like Zn-dependent dehydrogenase
MASNTMKALNYVGPFKVQVQEVQKPKLAHPDDIIVKVTSVRLEAQAFLRE